MKRVRGLDTIRFFCALWVVITHLGIYSGDKIVSGWFNQAINEFCKLIFNGPAAVIVFFVISGFCIHYPYANGIKIHLGEFYARRYLRIGIPVVVAVLVSKVVQVELSFFNDAILWSLVAEVIYYTLYPVLMKLKNKIGWQRLLPLCFVLSYCVIALNPTAKNYPSFGIAFNWLLGLPCWLLGCRLAERFTERSAHLNIGSTPTRATIWMWRLGILVVSSVFLVLRFHTPLGFPYTLNLFAIAVYYWLYQEINYFQEHEPAKVFEKAGQWSYSLYLTHVVSAAIFANWVPLNQAYLQRWLMLMMFVMLAAYAFFWLVEKPSHGVARWFKRFALVPPQMP